MQGEFKGKRETEREKFRSRGKRKKGKKLRGRENAEGRIYDKYRITWGNILK
jgi:hypothetical protein